MMFLNLGMVYGVMKRVIWLERAFTIRNNLYHSQKCMATAVDLRTSL